MTAFTLSTPKKVIKKSKLKILFVICTCLVVIGLYALPSYALGGVNRNPVNYLSYEYNYENNLRLKSYNLTTPGIAFMAYKTSRDGAGGPPSNNWSFVDWTTNTNTFTFTNNNYPFNRYSCLVFNAYQRETNTFYRSNFFIDNSIVSYGTVEFTTAFTMNSMNNFPCSPIYVYFGLYVANSSLLSQYNFDHLYGNKTSSRFNIASTQTLPLGLDNYRSSFIYLDAQTISPQINYNSPDILYHTSFRVDNFQDIIEEFETKKRILAEQDNASVSAYHLYPIIIYDFGYNNDISIIRQIKNPSFWVYSSYNEIDYNAYREIKLLNFNVQDPSAGNGFTMPDGTLYNPYNNLPFTFFNSYWASLASCSCIGLLLMLLPVVLILKGGLR